MWQRYHISDLIWLLMIWYSWRIRIPVQYNEPFFSNRSHICVPLRWDKFQIHVQELPWVEHINHHMSHFSIGRVDIWHPSIYSCFFYSFFQEYSMKNTIPPNVDCSLDCGVFLMTMTSCILLELSDSWLNYINIKYRKH